MYQQQLKEKETTNSRHSWMALPLEEMRIAGIQKEKHQDSKRLHKSRETVPIKICTANRERQARHFQQLKLKLFKVLSTE